MAVPKFEMPAGSINVLSTPAEFYETLKAKILAAKNRVFLATLYIGKSENELIETLRQALTKNPELQVYVLSDALRGTREAPTAPCSASLLAPLVKQFGNERVHLQMYHTPALHGLRNKVIPKRFNEGWGLQHMKLYGFDDEIILSGANLSKDYFTNRQDRYILFKSGALTNYYFRIHRAVAQLSYTVVPVSKDTNTVDNRPAGEKIKAFLIKKLVPKQPEPTFTLEWTQGPYFPDPINSPDQFIQKSTEILTPLLKSSTTFKTIKDRTEDCPTLVYPISQFSPLLQSKDTSTEFPVISRVLSTLGSNAFNWTFTAGYFNIHPEYKAKLLRSSPPDATVITASPKANGFYLSKGVSGLLPDAYSLLASQFLAEVEKTQNERHHNSSIKLVEWEKGTVNTPGGWSFHAKGIWVSAPKIATDSKTEIPSPCITVVGSSNYTRRGYTHDLESNALIITRDSELQAQLKQEVDNLLQNTGEPMTLKKYEERKPTPVLKALTWVLGEKL
ncbi:hypothetical protein D0Z03_001842 [Geotrichum reessii]|nr:hypothetical protein D0Z03_001842 [Galactomyces reessii]